LSVVAVTHTDPVQHPLHVVAQLPPLPVSSPGLESLPGLVSADIAASWPVLVES
jgi:hypothetical protein